jgi:hypothetical protein
MTVSTARDSVGKWSGSELARGPVAGVAFLTRTFGVAIMTPAAPRCCQLLRVRLRSAQHSGHTTPTPTRTPSVAVRKRPRDEGAPPRSGGGSSGGGSSSNNNDSISHHSSSGGGSSNNVSRSSHGSTPATNSSINKSNSSSSSSISYSRQQLSTPRPNSSNLDELLNISPGEPVTGVAKWSGPT